jgi:hypothetical protein
MDLKDVVAILSYPTQFNPTESSQMSPTTYHAKAKLTMD